MTNMSIPVASGIGGSEPATCWNRHEVGLILLKGRELSEEIHYESGPGELNAWQGCREPLASPSRYLFLRIVVHHNIPSLSILTCSHQKS